MRHRGYTHRVIDAFFGLIATGEHCIIHHEEGEMFWQDAKIR
ncbi:hypothetical protein ACFOGG_15085 [Brenneria rubrifaciens]